MSAQLARRARPRAHELRSDAAPARPRPVPMTLVPDAPPSIAEDETEALRRINREAGRLQAQAAALRDVDALLAQAAGLVGRALGTASLDGQDDALALASLALRDLDRRARDARSLDGLRLDRGSLGIAALELESSDGIAMALPLLQAARGHVRNALLHLDEQLACLIGRFPAGSDSPVEIPAIGAALPPLREITDEAIDELLR